MVSLSRLEPNDGKHFLNQSYMWEPGRVVRPGTVMIQRGYCLVTGGENASLTSEVTFTRHVSIWG